MHLHGIPNGQSGRAYELQQKVAATDKVDEDRRAGEAHVRKDSKHSVTSEVIRLADTLRRIPDVREEVVARASERYASGYYLTQEAAEQTADRLLGD